MVVRNWSEGVIAIGGNSNSANTWDRLRCSAYCKDNRITATIDHTSNCEGTYRYRAINAGGSR